MSDPTCHSELDQLHPGVSSGAAEIYAASVALTEVLHLSCIVEEMRDSMGLPLEIKVDNTTAIAFSKGSVCGSLGWSGCEISHLSILVT